MSKILYFNEISKIILEKLPKNANNCVITDSGMDSYDTIYSTKGGEIFVFNQKTKEKRLLEELDENTLYEIFVYLDANKQILAIRENLVELSLDDTSWVKEPMEIKNGDEVIGMVGVARMEKIDDKELLSVVYISPDGTFSNLTMFGNDNADEIELAMSDLRKISEFLHNLSYSIKETI